VALAYAIGVKEPVMIDVETDTNFDATEWVKQFDLSPKGIIEFLDLRKPIFENTASYGHFGREGFSWEEISKK
jgi:S-adenosylmethionine synthetase